MSSMHCCVGGVQIRELEGRQHKEGNAIVGCFVAPAYDLRNKKCAAGPNLARAMQEEGRRGRCAVGD